MCTLITHYKETRKCIERVCERCNKPFMAPIAAVNRGKGRFCSNSCTRGEPRMIVQCQECGELFKIASGHFKRGKGKYCSVACQYAAAKSHTQTTCITCGKSFMVQPCKLKMGLGKYCSKECSERAHIEYRLCLNCGICFKAQKSRLEIDKDKCCSKACSYQYQHGGDIKNGKYIPKGNPNKAIRQSFEYSEWRENIFERDSYTCQNCGQHGGRLEAHHLFGFARWPELRFDLDNGITLCEKCHAKLGSSSSYDHR